ncbi:MAG: hypothetical protein QXU32_01800 [Nitrososphaerales archaeon]
MAFVSINIQYKLAVRNGFVEIPDQPKYSTKLTVDDVLALIPGSVRRRQVHTANRLIDQEWVELPAFDKADGPASDYYKTLRTAAAS